MQEDKIIDTKLALAIQNLQETTLKKVEEAKYLETKITKLNIENVKLRRIIDNLKIEMHSINSDKDAEKLAIKNVQQSQNFENTPLLSKEVSEDINMSITQFKSILKKNKNK